MPRSTASLVALVLVVAAGIGGGPDAGGEAGRGGTHGPADGVVGAGPSVRDVVADAERWTWPVAGAAVARPYLAPATRYASGHRGVDLDASVGTTVVAPTDGVVLFVGRVVDRSLLTLDAGEGRVVTVEPIVTSLDVGAVVERGDPLGIVDVGGHVAAGAVHLGVRVDGEYVDPMRYFGGTPRAILLPCC